MNKKIVFIPVGLFFTSIGHSQKKKTLINMRLKITMRKVISFFVFCIIPFGIYGQNAYFITDSISSFGVNITDNGDLLNARFCTVESAKGIIRYTPNEVKEYGLNDGRIYVSKTIFADDSLKKVFMLRLVKGKFSLYYYRGKNIKTFYWQKDSTTLYELPKYHKDHPEINFRKDLEYLTSDCENVRNATKLVSYNIKSLTKLVTNYNDCVLKPFQHFRYGLLLGYGLNKLETSPDQLGSAANINFDFVGGVLPGIFIDYPIKMSNISLHTDLYFTKNGYSYYSSYVDKDLIEENTFFVANTTSINIPVLLRYTFPTINVRPFLNAGFIYTYNIKNSTGIYTSTIYPTYIQTTVFDENSHITKNELGISAGAGVEYILNYKHSVFFELRYNKLFSLPNENNLNKSEFQLIVGVNI